MFGKSEWIAYFFLKKYTMKRIDDDLRTIFTTAESLGAEKLYPAHLAFQMYANGCISKAEQIITEAKSRYPELPYDKIPEFIAEDERAYLAGEEQDAIIRRRIESVYFMFTGKPMDESLKAFFTEPPKEEYRVYEPGVFKIGDPVVSRDGSISGRVDGSTLHCDTDKLEICILTDGRTGRREFEYLPVEEVTHVSEKINRCA